MLSLTAFLDPQISVFYRASPRHKLKIVKVSRQEVQFINVIDLTSSF